MRVFTLLALLFVGSTTVIMAVARILNFNVTGNFRGLSFPSNDHNVNDAGQLKNNKDVIRSATSFQANGRGGSVKWPRVGDHFSIPYCYHHQDSKDQAKKQFEKAIEVWMNALGGQASQSSGHRIKFHEITDDQGNSQFCDLKGDMNNDEWNEKLPFDVLIVAFSGGNEFASMGFHAMDPPKRGMNIIGLGPDAPLVNVVHEVGHVLGMAHEHQRADRDYYVKYQCNQLIDFDERWKQAQEEDADISVKDFCEDPVVANRNIFRGFDFTRAYNAIKKENSEELGKAEVFSENSAYDITSIMHYETDTSDAKDECKNGDLSKCHLVKYIDPANHDLGVEKIEQNTEPSQGDIAWVKRTYPW